MPNQDDSLSTSSTGARFVFTIKIPTSHFPYFTVYKVDAMSRQRSCILVIRRKDTNNIHSLSTYVTPWSTQLEDPRFFERLSLHHRFPAS